MKPPASAKPVVSLMAGLVESLTKLFGPAPRRQFTEKDLASLNLCEPFNRGRIVAAALAGANPFDKEDLDRVRLLMAENLADNAKLEVAGYDAVRARYKEDPGGLDAQPLKAQLDQAQQVRQQIKAGMRARRKEIGEILKPGLLETADAVDKAALDLLEAEAAAAHHFGMAFTPSTLVRAIASAGRMIRNQAEFEATAPDLCGMTCGVVQQ